MVASGPDPESLLRLGVTGDRGQRGACKIAEPGGKDACVGPMPMTDDLGGPVVVDLDDWETVAADRGPAV